MVTELGTDTGTKVAFSLIRFSGSDSREIRSSLKKKGDHEIFVAEEAAGQDRERVITQTDSFSVPSAFDVHRSVLERSSGGKAELVGVRSRERRERPRENFWIARLTRAALWIRNKN